MAFYESGLRLQTGFPETDSDVFTTLVLCDSPHTASVLINDGEKPDSKCLPGKYKC